MKVLVTTSVFPRWRNDATPPFVENLCRDLAEAGCRITVLAPHSPGAAFREERDGLRIVRYPYLWPLRYQSICYEGGMIVRRRGSRWRQLQLPFLAIAQFFAMQRLLQEPFDLIHAHSLLPQGWIAGLANAAGAPLITSSHGSDVFGLKKRWAPLLSHAVNSSSALIANSRATRNRLMELGARSNRVHLIPATPSYPDPEDPSHRPPACPVILFAGRIIPEKGVDILVEAMPEIRAAFPQCTLRIAGSGNMEPELKDRVAHLGLADAVTFTGWLPPDKLRGEMQTATILAAPSRVMEGQNLVVTEALSVGCPVATSARGGVLDLVIHEETGFVFPDLVNAGTIAKSLITYLRKPDALSTIGSAGFHHFTRNFSRQRVSGLTLRLYGSLRHDGSSGESLPSTG